MKRICTIQDISCLGQCSLTVALPIISAAGIEASIIPTAVLSTHTGGFKNFTFCDLTEEMPKIEKHWIEENMKFSGFYTGYIGSVKQIDYIMSIMDSCKEEDCLKLVDPCMADNGKLYLGFKEEFPKEMLRLCKIADVIVPNITEACFLLDREYRTNFNKEEIEDIVKSLYELTNSCVVLTGVSFNDNELGCCVYNKGSIYYYFTEKIPYMFHGTGDCYASSLFAGIIKGLSIEEASKLACEFTLEAIKQTVNDRNEHWYGVHFEKALHLLTCIGEK